MLRYDARFVNIYKTHELKKQFRFTLIYIHALLVNTLSQKANGMRLNKVAINL